MTTPTPLVDGHRVTPPPDARSLDERSVRRALLGAVAVAGVCWALVLVVWDEAPFAVTFDDAWYYFEIGRNLAAGEGSTFDTLNETNGYHPLWMAVTTGAYAVGLDDLGAVRALLLVQLACWLGALTVVAEVARRAIDGFPRLAGRLGDAAGPPAQRALLTTAAALALVGGNPYVVKTTVNGLESGLVVASHAAVLGLLWRRRGSVLAGTSRSRVGLGVLLALAFLARTDAILLVGCLGLWSLAEARPMGAAAVWRLVQVFAPPGVAAAGWFALNQAVFGDPMQVSGELKRLPLTGSRAVTLAVIGLLALALGWRSFRRHGEAGRRSRLPRTATFVVRTGWYAAFLLLLLGYYTQLSAQQWLWYFAPHVLYLTFLATLAAADFCEGVVLDAPKDRSPLRAMVPIQGILLAVFGVALGMALTSFSDPNQRSIQLANRDAGRWISTNLPDDAVLGSWDAGVLGYFTDQPIINLDGVVNSFEWIEARESGTTREFLLSRGMAYTANHAPLDADGEDAGIRRDITRLVGPDEADAAQQVHREEFTYSGRIEGASGSGDRPWAVFVYRFGGGEPPTDGTP